VKTFPVVLEIGTKRIFASAGDWPGWTRSGRTEEAALQSLLDYGVRYQRAIRSAKLDLQVPADISNLVVVERLTGTTTTDFGAPDVASTADSKLVDEASLLRLTGILNACWDSLGTVVQSAAGQTLRKGPRGGGRELLEIFRHVVEAHYSYLPRINGSSRHDEALDVRATLKAVKSATKDALANSLASDAPKTGPRGGKRWPPRYFFSRAAWHILDHVWEIEDRLKA
jgi:hypothetical protein